ncbi:uncharacterized protein [Ptychodera flava]|uniref:uncharacterized protein n=1 Tax=Ptychodera flava TaxID=63121 RepID=UPI003969DC8B
MRGRRNWSGKPTCILKDTEPVDQTRNTTSTGAIVGTVVGALITVAFITVTFILYRRKQYSCRYRHKQDLITVTERFVRADRNATDGEINGYDQEGFDIREYETISDAVKLDHAAKMNISEPVELAKLGESNDSTSGATAVENSQERDDKLPYEKLDPKTRNEHLYTGLAKYEEIQERVEIREYETVSDAVKLDHVGKINIAEPVGKAKVDETNNSPSGGIAIESPQERGDRLPYEKLDPKTRNEHLYIGLT